MGLARISEFAHHAESLLSRVRDREIEFSGHCADLSLRSADMLRDAPRQCGGRVVAASR